jgi:formylglycine-generating enzyme required for sulfatase activity
MTSRLMRKLLACCTTVVVTVSAYSEKMPDNLVFVRGGAFKNTNSNYYGKSIFISSFYIGKYEVTQQEWSKVMESNPSKFKGDNLPVETVSWYDSVEYCNKRSIKEGLTPYYNIDGNHKDPNNLPDPSNGDLDEVKWRVTINAAANGYRLPTEAEWEYAASGGQMSKSYTYSGGNDADKVAWYWQNSGDTNLTGFWNWPAIEQNHGRTKPVGGRLPNELGLYDMSGNVREWCWDWYGDLQSAGTWRVVENDPMGPPSGFARVQRGGGWIGDVSCCESSYRGGGFEADGRGPDQGFRLCRSK